jgi:hypothetical protein
MPRGRNQEAKKEVKPVGHVKDGFITSLEPNVLLAPSYIASSLASIAITVINCVDESMLHAS